MPGPFSWSWAQASGADARSSAGPSAPAGPGRGAFQGGWRRPGSLVPGSEGLLDEAPDRQPPGAPEPLRAVLAVVNGLVLDQAALERENPAVKRTPVIGSLSCPWMNSRPGESREFAEPGAWNRGQIRSRSLRSLSPFRQSRSRRPTEDGRGGRQPTLDDWDLFYAG
jgi:hypothetical protein